MAAKSKETLEQGLGHSATKKGLTGEARQRYIGGGIRNMEKRGSISKIKANPKKGPRPKVARERISLVVKKNTAASKNRPYDVYSIYKEGQSTPYSESTYRKRAVALQNAKVEMDAHNQGLKQRKLKT